MVNVSKLTTSGLIDLRLDSAGVRAREWSRHNAVKIAEKTYGRVFVEQAKSKKMSDRYIESIKFHLKGKNTPNADLEIAFDVKSYKTEDGKPLWKFFEKGTKKHWIYPRVKKALRWKTGDTASQTQTVTQRISSGTAGDPVYAFSKGHQVSGIKARSVLYWTKQFGLRKFQSMFVRELQAFMDNTATKVGV